MYKEEDIYVGMKLECVNVSHYTHWTEGKVYEVDENFQIYSDTNSSRNIDSILLYLNNTGKDEIIFKVIKEESKEIVLTIKGKTFYDIRNEAEELLNLVNSIIEASEELGISEEKVRRIYGGKTNE